MMEDLSLNSALVITLISVAASLVLFLSMFSGDPCTQSYRIARSIQGYDDFVSLRSGGKP